MARGGVCSGVVGGCDGDLGDAVARGDAVRGRGGWGPRTRVAQTPFPMKGRPPSKCVWVCDLDGKVA